jgi:Ca2+-binding RTX toxin-like protein
MAFVVSNTGNGVLVTADGADDTINLADIAGVGAENKVTAGAGNDTVNGSNGNDKIFGGAGTDILNGGNGNDWLDAGNGANSILNGGNGNDSLTAAKNEDTKMFGGAGNDTLLGQNGNDTLSGGNGADILIGGKGNDVLEGGEGNDKYVFNLGDGRDSVRDFGNAGQVDTASFGASVNKARFIYVRKGEDLYIGNLDSTDQILVRGQFRGDGSGLEVIKFADGSSITAAQITTITNQVAALNMGQTFSSIDQFKASGNYAGINFVP